jgi:hypothetical protein
MYRVARYAPVLAACLTLAVAGCNNDDKPDAKGQLTMQGTVHATQAADGTPCWEFQSAKGKAYELQPAQVPAELLVDGAQATIVAKPRTGFSYCKVGTIVDVVTLNPTAAPSS